MAHMIAVDEFLVWRNPHTKVKVVQAHDRVAYNEHGGHDEVVTR